MKCHVCQILYTEHPRSHLKPKDMHTIHSSIVIALVLLIEKEVESLDT